MDDESDSSRRVKAELFIQMDGLNNNSGVHVIAATNTPDQLDAAILRRFSRLVYIPLPSFDTRLSLFKKRYLTFGEEEYKQMANMTNR